MVQLAARRFRSAAGNDALAVALHDAIDLEDSHDSCHRRSGSRRGESDALPASLFRLVPSQRGKA